MQETNLHEGSSEGFRADCPCLNNECPRHGYCDECEAHHAEKGNLPYCRRTISENT